MYRQRNEMVKWIAVVLCVVGFAGLVWYNRKASEAETWVQVQTHSGVPQVKEEASVTVEPGVPVSTGPKAAEQEQPPVQIVVHVSGAVVKPGVYALETAARVVDALKAAGGVTGSADLDLINLAEPLVDGAKVYIPYRGTTEGLQGSAVVARGTTGAQSGSSAGGMGAALRGGRVNINTATSEELQTLPGIGPSKAEAILRYRAEKGRFQRLEDLMLISGIGEKTFAKLKDLITI